MASLKELVDQGVIELYETVDTKIMPVRSLYFSTSCAEWYEDQLSLEPRDQGSLDPKDQMDVILDSYVKGDLLNSTRDEELKILDPEEGAVWAFKSEDVRLLGVFHKKGVFIALHGDMRKDLKPHSKYDEKRKKVIVLANKLDLSLPKYIDERDYRNVT